MDTSLSLRSHQQHNYQDKQFDLQLQSLLHSQQQAKLAPYPPPSPSPDPWFSTHPSADTESHSPPSFQASADGDSPSSLAPLAADDVLMDPVLEYITDMLMDENMEDRKCMQQECTSYQAIINGFYQDLQSSSPTDPEPEQDEVYRWIKEVLVADSPQPYSNGESSDLNDVISEKDSVNQWLRHLESSNSTGSLSSSEVRSFDSSSSGSPVSVYSQADSPTALLEPSYYANSVQTLISKKTEEPVPPPILSTLPILQEILETTNSLISQNERRASERKSLSYTLQNGLQMKPSPSINASFEPSLSSLGELAYANGKPVGFSSRRNVTAVQTQAVTEEEKKEINGAEKTDENPISFVNNEYLRAECQAKMYGDWLPSKDNCLAKKMKARVAANSQKSNGNPEPVDLRALLVDCAQAFGSGNLRKANELVQELRQYATPDGTVSQRLAHYFTEGLVARLEGTGAQRYTAMSTNRPSAAIMLKAYRLMVEVCPFVKLSHYHANENILKVAEGASRLHIVDYGILYGVQWPSLISALAERKGGPPFLRITGIEFPQPGINPKERVEETGRKLSEYARAYNVPFQYNAIAKKWEDIEADDLDLQKGEVLVVNCVLRLRHLMDETVVNPSPRRKVLSRIYSFKPDIVVIAVVNAGFNAPFFVSRFREALYHYSSKFDMIDSTVCENDNHLRALMERECMGRDILNVVACEGPERVERPETYRQWHARFERAGFECVPLDRSVFSKAKYVIRSCYHKDYTIDTDSKWMLLGWKGRINEGLSAWKPTGTPL